jgi:MoaA/NifB/PqqE/SkfB family radical SAM enzyme
MGINHKNIVIFGASNAGKSMKHILDKKKMSVQYFVDNDSSKWQTEIDGIPISSPQELLNQRQNQHYIIVASMYYKEIALQLESMGFQYYKDFTSDLDAEKFLFENKYYYDGEFIGRFCSMPFAHFEVSWAGDVFLCCTGSLPTSIGNLKNNNVNEVWNSDIAKAIRKSVLDGTYEFCCKQQCEFMARNTLPLKTEISDPYYQNIIQANQTELAGGPIRILTCVDPTCNLTCPSCRTKDTYSDSKYIMDGKKIHNRIIADAKYYVNLEELVVSGNGDPFASHIYRDLLENINIYELPKMKVFLTTNGQLFTPENWEKLKNIHGRVRGVNVSIDAASSETYHLLRRGGQFEKLLRNLEFVSELRQNGQIGTFDISFVAQKDNYKEMEEFIRLGRQFKVDIIRFNLVRNFGHLSESEFADKAVYLEGHPEYTDFINIINKPIFRGKDVEMGNVGQYIKDLPC